MRIAPEKTCLALAGVTPSWSSRTLWRVSERNSKTKFSLCRLETVHLSTPDFSTKKIIPTCRLQIAWKGIIIIDSSRKEIASWPNFSGFYCDLVSLTEGYIQNISKEGTCAWCATVAFTGVIRLFSIHIQYRKKVQHFFMACKFTKKTFSMLCFFLPFLTLATTSAINIPPPPRTRACSALVT